MHRVNHFLLFHFVLRHDILNVLSSRYPATGGGDLHGNCNLFSCLLHGWCSLPLHHQMVRRRQVGQHWPSGFLSTIKKQEEAPSIRSTEGFTLFVCMGLLFLFAYGNYSICKSWNQYTILLEIQKFSHLSQDCHRLIFSTARTLVFTGFLSE